MKTLLVILCTILWGSCSRVWEGDVVTHVYYYTKDMWEYTTQRDIDFLAPPNTYQVGDTVHFLKPNRP